MKILFVCSSNICRSPYAEFIFKRIVDNNEILKKNITSVTSAAVFNNSKVIFDKTVTALVNEGFNRDDVILHKPCYKSQVLPRFEDADVIIGMSAIHKILTPRKYRKKFITLSEAAIGKSLKIPDPFLIKSQERYDDIMDIIKTFLDLYSKNLIDSFSKNQ
ncbi:MAG: hypothetical protein RR357_02140 [Clostridia bacterium]